MKTLSFELTMPNVGSWNGKWTGADKHYFVIKVVDNKTAAKIMNGAEIMPIVEGFFNPRQIGNTLPRKNYHYSWDDGWGASICVEQITAREGNKRRKLSSGFWGYEWMVDSIIIYDEILDTNQRKAKKEQELNNN